MTDFEPEDFDLENETICLDCGELSDVADCGCCGGQLCYQCFECSAGFCGECSNAPDFNDRMLARFAEAFEPETKDIPF